jgi:hypothetical protein
MERALIYAHISLGYKSWNFFCLLKPTNNFFALRKAKHVYYYTIIIIIILLHQIGGQENVTTNLTLYIVKEE